MFKRRVILIILCTIGLLSVASFFSLLIYFDPYINPLVSLILLTSSFASMIISLLGVFLYLTKKIYYRGEVGMFHVFSSLRQSFFVATFCLGTIAAVAFQVPYILPLLVFASLLIFLELFIQNL